MRRLCNTVGGRFIDGAACCCVVSTARSRAAATTNFTRSNQSLVLRALFGGSIRFALVNGFRYTHDRNKGDKHAAGTKVARVADIIKTTVRIGHSKSSRPGGRARRNRIWTLRHGEL
jgi:hypothetical protein